MLFYASDLFAKKMAAEVATCLQQPESCDIIKNTGRLWDVRSIKAILWMEITEPVVQVYLLGR